MASKKKQDAGTQTTSTSTETKTDGEVTLLIDSINAHGKPCRAGTVIAPDVEGWPKHRVVNHILNKKAK